MDKTEREVSKALNMAKTTLHREKERILAKKRKLWRNNFLKMPDQDTLSFLNSMRRYFSS